MQNIVPALERLLPDAVEMFKGRYMLLQTIRQHEPIGRRGLVAILNLSERTIRREVELLAENGLVEVSGSGIRLTEDGDEVLGTLYLPLHMLEEVSRLEEHLVQILGVKKAIVVKGNLDEQENIKEALGFAGASLLANLLKDDYTVSITGGTTIAHMVKYMPRQVAHCKNICVLPARGSVGQKVELQAHTIAAELAKKLDAKYELLTIPDNLSNQSISLIKNEPSIQKLLQNLAGTDIIIFGIGDALKMAKHRKEPKELFELLKQQGAIAESFRHYFNEKGQIIYAHDVIGISPDLAKEIPVRIAVVAGTSKAPAILATKDLLRDSYLILDEGAAKEILNISTKLS